MPDTHDNPVEIPGMDRLLAVEQEIVLSHALVLPAGRALMLHATTDYAPGNLQHLSGVHLHRQHDRLVGDAVCAADTLAFGKESFRLVVIQHCADSLPCVDRLINELDRVLMPGGTLLWFGSNPWSARELPRRLGDAARNRPMSSLSAGRLRQLLLRRSFGVFDVNGLGGIWSPAGERSGPRWLDPFRGAYQLSARKQVVTPLRPQAGKLARRVHMAPQLAGTQSRRLCA